VPERIQRKREKGWKAPTNTVFVGRGTKWANPYWPGVSVQLKGNGTHRHMTAEDALARYRRDLPYLIDKNFGPLDISELRGKNLMCWCKIGAPCHADILLEVANRDRSD
jgi:hypothetical protein